MKNATPPAWALIKSANRHTGKWPLDTPRRLAKDFLLQLGLEDK